MCCVVIWLRCPFVARDSPCACMGIVLGMDSGVGKPPAIATVPARQGGVWAVSAGAAVLG